MVPNLIKWVEIGALVLNFIGIIILIISILVSSYQFQLSKKRDDYSKFIEDIDSALLANNSIESSKYLNKAFSRSLVTMDDKMATKIIKILSGEFTKKERNLIYYYMRKDLNPNTEIMYEDIKDKYIEVKP